MIKKIHAVWLGKKMTPLTLACVDDWKKQGYDVKLWSDDDDVVAGWISGCSFAKVCYDKGLMAFVVDYLRLKILQECGGLYLDTDVTIRKDPFPLFSDSDFVVGLEKDKQYGNAIIYALPDSAVLNELVSFYENKIWSADEYMGPEILTKIVRSYGERDGVKVLPAEYFYSYKGDGSLVDFSDSAYLVHWFQHSWKSNKQIVFLKAKNKSFFQRIYIYQKYILRF